MANGAIPGWIQLMDPKDVKDFYKWLKTVSGKRTNLEVFYGEDADGEEIVDYWTIDFELPLNLGSDEAIFQMLADKFDYREMAVGYANS